MVDGPTSRNNQCKAMRSAVCCGRSPFLDLSLLCRRPAKSTVVMQVLLEKRADDRCVDGREEGDTVKGFVEKKVCRDLWGVRSRQWLGREEKEEKKRQAAMGLGRQWLVVKAKKPGTKVDGGKAEGSVVVGGRDERWAAQGACTCRLTSAPGGAVLECAKVLALYGAAR